MNLYYMKGAVDILSLSEFLPLNKKQQKVADRIAQEEGMCKVYNFFDYYPPGEMKVKLFGFYPTGFPVTGQLVPDHGHSDWMRDYGRTSTRLEKVMRKLRKWI